MMPHPRSFSSAAQWTAILLLACTVRLSAHCVPWGDNFETWLNGLWTASAATTQSVEGGINGSNAAFIDNADNLTLTTNLALYNGSTNMELSFWYRNTNNFEGTDYLYVEINRNGAGWITAYSQAGNQDTYVQIFVDLDAAGTMTDNYQIRFRAGSSFGNEDVYIDDVLITGYPPSSPKIWDGGGGTNGRWNTATNWSDNVLPCDCDSILFNTTSSANCTLDVADVAHHMVVTPDYGGNFNFSANTLTLSGNLSFLPGGTVTPESGAIQLTGISPVHTQQIVPKSGLVMPGITQNGDAGSQIYTNNLTAGTLTMTSGNLDLGTGMNHTVSSIATTAGNLDFGSSTLNVTGNANLNGGTFTITPGSGALAFTGSGSQTFTPKTGATHPNIVHTGTGTLTQAAAYTCGNFSQSAGTYNFNSTNLTVNGNLSVTNGTSTTFQNLTSNLLITVGGIASFFGQSGNLLNLNSGTSWRINMNTDGALSAMFASINNSTVTSTPPNGEANECIDGGTNTGWTFISENYNTWSYSKKIFINTTASGANTSTNVVNFPMLLRLTPTNADFAQIVGAAGEDIRFAKADGIHLDYQIESWNDGVEAIVWVKLDTVYANNNTQYFVMYWGKTAATSRSNGSKVFQSANDFVGVYHLNENGNTAAGGYGDATGVNSGTGTALTGASDVAAVVGTGSTFNGTSQYITVSDAPFDLTDNFTLSTWIYTSDATGDWARVIDKIDRWALGYGLGAKWGAYGFAAYWSTTGWGADPAATFEPMNDATWYHLTATIAGGVARSYRNGELISTNAGCAGQTITTTNNPIRFGRSSNAAEYWAGTLDEIRIDNTPRSADWIKLSYESQKSGASILSSPKIWTGGGSGSNWSTGANWSGGTVPAATDEVLFDNSSAKDCSFDGSAAVKSITFTSGYSGVFSFGASTTMTVTGSADFSSGGSFSSGAGSVIAFTGTTAQTFVPKTGYAFPSITQNGSGGTTIMSNNLTAGTFTLTSGTITLGSGLSHSITSLSGGSGGGIDFGSSTLSATGNVTMTNLTVTAGTGTLVFTGSSDQTFTPVTGCPNITHTGSNNLILGAALNCASFSQSAGALNLGSYNITTSGNFTITNGTSGSFANLGGRTIRVYGNASFTGQVSNLLNMNANAWNIQVDGNLAAHYATIGNSSAAGYSQGQASATCVENPVSSNTNWSFSTENYSTWTYSGNIYVNTTPDGANTTSTVSNFPVLLRLTASNFNFSQAMTNGEDIRFAASDGTPLSYQIERWVNASSAAEIWVLLNTVYGNNKSQYFKMHWGKGGSTSRSSGSAVFSNSAGHTAVWHLNNSLNDATSNAITLTNNGSSNTTAIIGEGRNFPANNTVDIPTAAAMNALTTFSISGWARTTNYTASQTLFSFYYDWNNYIYLRNDATNGIVIKNWINGMNNGWQVATNWFPSNNTWFHVAWIMDGEVWKVYINGTLSASSGQTMTMNDMPNNFYGSVAAERTGAGPYGTYWTGMTDEVTIAGVARPADWIKLSYETQKAAATSVYFSSSPIVTGPSGAGLLTALQHKKDSVRITYQVSDPNGGTVTISGQYKPSGGGWTNMSNTNGTGSGIDATSSTTDRYVYWGARAQLGSSVEGYYFTRLIAEDPSTNRDTTASDSFFIDTRAPTGLGSFTTSTITGTTIQLTWTSANDINFDHYEIWYGTVRNDVRDRTGGAQEWDNIDDAAMTTKTTATTTISGLSTGTTYYFKIWAADSWQNEDTLASISAATTSTVGPVWSATSLGAINGGSIGASKMYIGSGASAYALKAINLSNGTTAWSVSTSPNSCSMPTYYWTASGYKIVVSSGTNVIGKLDDGSASPTHLFTSSFAAAPTTPYISLDGNYFFAGYTSGGARIDKRSMSTGASVGGNWPIVPTSYNPSSDIAIYNDELYGATTNGRIFKTDMDGTTISYSPTLAGGASINLPLLVSMGTLYVTPNATSLVAVNTSGLTQKWSVSITTANTGAAFLDGNKIYVACGNFVRRVTDNGSPSAVDWSSPDLGATVNSGPIVYNNVVYVGRNTGRFYALKDADGTVYSAAWPYTGATGNANTGPWIDAGNGRVLIGTDGGDLRAFTMY